MGKIYCYKCEGKRNHEILKEHVDLYKEETGYFEVTKFQIIQCKGCDEISFRKLFATIADIEYANYVNNPEGALSVKWERVSPYSETLFPNISAKLFWSLESVPAKIKEIYIQTIKAYHHDLTLLCGIGLRGIVEATCQDKGITDSTGRTLMQKITQLSNQGYLKESDAEILKHHKWIGDKAVHKLESPTRKELEIAIEIIGHILDNIYKIPEKDIELRSEILKRYI